MLRRDDLLALSRPALARVLREGHPIDARALDDTAYRGISLGLPAFVERLTWKTFQKTFHRDPQTGLLRGWNVRVEQRGLDAPSVARTRHGRPWTFGHYRVVDPQGRLPRGFSWRGLLIHYGLGEHRPFDPAARVRDPIVAVNEGSVELLLGWSFVDLGFAAAGTPSYFLLEREGPLQYVPPSH